jgi:hypothetical protein
VQERNKEEYMRKFCLAAVTAFLALVLAACAPRAHQCPASIPGQAGATVPVIVVDEESGQQVAATQAGAECQADSDGDKVGDETEVEHAEEQMNPAEAD